MHKEQQYDATLAVLVDGQIGNNFLRPENDNVQVLDEKTQRFLPIGVDMRSVIDAIREETNPRHIEVLARVAGGYMDHHPRFEWAEALGRADEIMDLIADGRLKIALLLDSFGGSLGILNDVCFLLKQIRNNCGSIAAFGGRDVFSAPAYIFMEADRGKRFMNRRTNLGFHLSTMGNARIGPDRYIVTEDGEEEWQILSEMLIDETRSSMRARLQAGLDEAIKLTDVCPDRRFTFMHGAAESFGFAKVPAWHGSSIIKEFEKFTGVSGLPAHSRVEKLLCKING